MRRSATAKTPTGFPHEITFTDDDYLDHESWVRHCFGSLGEIRGKRLLDYGCGAGFASVVLARRGAMVAAFDISPDQVRLARRRAEENGVRERVWAAVMTAERLAYDESTFDAVYGNAILHHVNLEPARRELYRVMKAGAVAVFAEPLGENPLLEFARNQLPYPGKHRDQDERPLRYRNIELLARSFARIQIKEFQLLSMIRRLTGNGPLIELTERLDERLIAACPPIRRFSRYVTIVLQK